MDGEVVSGKKFNELTNSKKFISLFERNGYEIGHGIRSNAWTKELTDNKSIIKNPCTFIPIDNMHFWYRTVDLGWGWDPDIYTYIHHVKKVRIPEDASVYIGYKKQSLYYEDFNHKPYPFFISDKVDYLDTTYLSDLFIYGGRDSMIIGDVSGNSNFYYYSMLKENIDEKARNYLKDVFNDNGGRLLKAYFNRYCRQDVDLLKSIHKKYSDKIPVKILKNDFVYNCIEYKVEDTFWLYKLDREKKYMMINSVLLNKCLTGEDKYYNYLKPDSWFFMIGTEIDLFGQNDCYKGLLKREIKPLFELIKWFYIETEELNPIDLNYIDPGSHLTLGNRLLIYIVRAGYVPMVEWVLEHYYKKRLESIRHKAGVLDLCANNYMQHSYWQSIRHKAGVLDLCANNYAAYIGALIHRPEIAKLLYKYCPVDKNKLVLSMRDTIGDWTYENCEEWDTFSENLNKIWIE